MDFRDRTLVRLADPERRGGLFDQRSLEHLVAAGYRTAPDQAGPYRPDFAELRLAVRLERPLTAEGSWAAPGGVDRREGRFTVTGLAGTTADALWRGTVTVHTAAGPDRATAVDAEPVQPAGGPALTVRYTAGGGTGPRPVALPVLVALLVRESVRPAELLAESRAVAEALGALAAVPAEAPLPPRPGVPVGWLVPAAAFDDPDWPGGRPGADAAELRALRIAAAGRLLAEQGIALIAVPEQAGTAAHEN